MDFSSNMTVGLARTPRMATLRTILVKMQNWAELETRNPTLDVCVGKTICSLLFSREEWALS